MATNKELEKDVNGLSEKLDAVVENSNQALDELDKKIDQKFDSISISMTELLDAFKSSKAKDNPVEVRKTLDPREDYEHSFKIKHGEEGSSIELSNTYSVDDPLFKAKAERTKFDQESVLIRVEESHIDDGMHDTSFSVSVNGNKLILEEGKEYAVPRAFVELLLRNIYTTVGCKKVVDSDGSESYEHPLRSSQRYPISIVEDKNPMGRAWYNSIRSERH